MAAQTEALHVNAVSVMFPGRNPGEQVHALDNISLTVNSGDFVVALGASGCGKTTLLNLMAGFLSPTRGTLMLGSRTISGPGLDLTARASRHCRKRRLKSTSYVWVMRPGRGDITTTRVARNRASSTLWVMKKNIFPVFCQTSSRSSWIVSRVSASSAAIGSSMSSVAGLHVSARAMPTRCCMPPDSW